jgi:hypothetical protein
VKVPNEKELKEICALQHKIEEGADAIRCEMKRNGKDTDELDPYERPLVADHLELANCKRSLAWLLFDYAEYFISLTPAAKLTGDDGARVNNESVSIH